MIKRTNINKRLQNLHKKNSLLGFDKALFIIVMILVVIGSVMVYDASLIYGFKRFGSQYHFLILHIAWVIVGLFLMIGALFLNLTKLKTTIVYAWLITLGLIIFTVISRYFFDNPFVPERNFAYRWFVVNPAPLPELPFIGRINLQPSEMFKLLSVLFASVYVSSKKIKEEFNSDLTFICVYMGIFLFPVPFIALQPNLSTALIYAAIIFFIPFFGGVKIKYLTIFLAVIVFSGLIFSLAEPYRRERIVHFLNLSESKVDEKERSNNQGDSEYHVNQIMIALGSGGFTGLGIGKSRQKFSYLPEVTADSIFAIVGEELGFIGAFSVMILIFGLIIRCFYIASHIRNHKLLSLMCYGIGVWLLIQSSINIGAMLRLIPITGVPIPLLSYGGSSTIFILSALGIVLNSSRYIEK